MPGQNDSSFTSISDVHFFIFNDISSRLSPSFVISVFVYRSTIIAKSFDSANNL